MLFYFLFLFIYEQIVQFQVHLQYLVKIVNKVTILT